nr:dna replication regulator sld2 [Quercus suber]
MVIAHCSDNEYAATLRLELKIWENEWATANGGQKPGREVVKNNASIAAKYKEYNRLSQRTLRSVETPRKRKAVLHERSTNPTAITPRRAEKKTTWTSKTSEPILDNPELEIEPTPAFIRCALGPTPQRDGQVLGIFDAFPCTATPSKPKSLPDPIAATPSKPSAPPSSDPALSRTPQSTGKRFYLDAFAGTPLKRKRDSDTDGETPSSTQRAFATPSFLRRSFPLAPIAEEENHEPGTRVNPSFKRRGGFVRTLSSMIQNLRRNEEQRMDDEWEIMQQIEAEEQEEQEEEREGKAHEEPAKRKMEANDLDGHDTEGAEMPLGPDMAAEGELTDDGSRDRGALDANGNPRKVWKKKGLKRQTKRVIMRPVLHKAQKAEEARDDDGDGDEEGEVCAVAETQLRSPGPHMSLQDDNDHDSSEFEVDDDDGDIDAQSAKKKARSMKNQTNAKLKDSTITTTTTTTTTVKKKRKVNDLAHANFRKLKIKNKNSKANGRGGPGGGRRFGGRR